MRRVALALAAGCGVATAATAQTPAPQAPATVAPFSMPGMTVGKPLLQPVGQQIPKAAPAAGTPVGTGPGGIPYALDPRAPKPPGQEIDLKNVIAPYPGMPKPAPSFWDRLEQRFMSLFESDTPAVKPPNWTPGLARRNKERERERMARRD